MSRSQLRFSLAAILWTMLLGFNAVPPARADIHPNTAPGFPAEQSFQVGDIDNINLFNGSLTLTIPIGGSYPVGGGFSYGLKLVYNGSPWTFESIAVTHPNGDPAGSVNQANYYSECSNAGLGWRLSLGRMNPPCQSPEASLNLPVYQDENGTDHIFFPTLHIGDPEDVNPSGVTDISYTRDGTYLRLKTLSSGFYEIEFPDGTVRKFYRTGIHAGMINEIRDSFGNHLVVSYNTDETVWTLSDNHGRTHTVNFSTYGTYKVVSSVSLKSFGGTPAVYPFNYELTQVGYACPQDNTVGGSSAMVPLLTSVTLPDGSSYKAAVSDYITAVGANSPSCTNAGGNLLRLTLPTLGRLEWTWQKYQFPSGSAQKPRLQTNDGVATRKMVDSNSNVLGTWTYQWSTVPSTPLTAKEFKTKVTDPLGHRNEHYFSVATDAAATGTWSRFDYGLPFTWYVPLSGVPGMNLSRQVFNSAGTLLRSEYVQYERDPFGGNSPPASTSTNRRALRSRTVYDDDIGFWTGVTFSQFDGLGHYRQQQTEAASGFAGADRTLFSNYNQARGTYTVNLSANTGTGYSVYPASSRWVLEAPSYVSESEGSQAAQTDLCYAADSLVVTRRRVHRQNGATPDTRDLVTVSDIEGAPASPTGNIKTEKFYGGDAQAGIGSGDLCGLTFSSPPEYQIDHTWSAGVRATSKYNGTTFFVLDQTIDTSTGLVSASRDSAGLTTNYSYDALNRRTWAMPQGSPRTGFTEYNYSRAQGSNPATVTVRRRDAGGMGGTPLVTQYYVFDSFGRIAKEQRDLPSGGNNTRTTTYDGVGNKDTVSELALGAASSPKTIFSFYDPFGRPGKILPPDGAAHEVTLGYLGVRQVTRTMKVGTNAGGGETSSVTTEVYDRHGRLATVAEPSGSGGSVVTTTYGYDVGNRLASVLSGSQVRSFVYDRAGLLTSETHPEKGTSGNGSVFYPRYDSHGHILRKTDGLNDLGFTYDPAERLTKVNEWNARLLKEFYYPPVNSGSNLVQGKLQKATRYNYLTVGTAPVTVVVDETYTYAARDGAVSTRATALQVSFDDVHFTPRESFTQDFAYNTLGLPSSLTYPTCTYSECKPPAPVFADVPVGHPDHWEIEAISRAGVTAGCTVATPPNLPNYCPTSNITRAEMAVFLIRAVEGANYTPPSATCTVFQDVPCNYWAIAWIEELYHRGLTAGCSTTPLKYCPESPVSKAEMSVFLLRNRNGLSYQPPPCNMSPFDDVPCGYWASPWILEAYRQGIIPKCDLTPGTNFCPENPKITRAQMAGYLARGFDLPVTLPPGTPRTIALTYSQGLLSQVTSGTLTYGSLFYHSNLLVSQVSHGNGVQETQTNDPNNMRRPAALAASGPYAGWSSGTYSYDGAGNIKAIGSSSFRYDKVNRLVASSLFDGPTGGGNLKQQNATFDSYGNLTSLTTNGTTLNTPTSTSTNRLTGVVSYDDAGNLKGWNTNAYQYDGFNQMTRMVAGSEDWNYIYTADDERIWSFSSGLSRWTLRDLTGKVLREFLSDIKGWTVGTDYIYRDGLLLAAETQAGRRHFHLDHLGTPRLITTASGDQDAYHVYYPFGGEATAINQDRERMKFTGHERDLANPTTAGDDLDYMHARHYSPVTGRFLSVDPQDSTLIKVPQSWNKYQYVLNNPLVFRDPKGRCVEDLCIGEAIVAGIAIEELIADAAVTGYLVTKLHDLYVKYTEAESGSDAKGKDVTESKSPGRTEHADQRAQEARDGDSHRQVGDANRVVQEGREFVDTKTGNKVFVKGDRVVVQTQDGVEVTRMRNTRANTLKRIRSGRWVPVTR